MDLHTAENASVPSIHLVPVPWNWRLIVQLVLAIIGIIGNSAVIHVYLHTRKLTKSATNRFIAGLAVADLVTSICIIPIPTLSHVPDNFGGHFYCKVVSSSFIMWVSIVASILSLSMLAVERFVAISQPVRYKRIFSVEMTRLIFIMIWLFAFAFNTFSLYVTHVDKANGVCYFDSGSEEFQMFFGVSGFIVKCLVPVILMLGANIRSIQLLMKQSEMFASKSKNTTILQARQRIVYMLFAVIVSFILCWSPDQFAFPGFNLGLVPFEYLFGNLYRAFVLLAFTNSCINPVLYALTNKNFRQAIKQHLFRCSLRLGESVNDPFDSPLDASDVSQSKTNSGGTNLSMSAPMKHDNTTITNNI